MNVEIQIQLNGKATAVPATFSLLDLLQQFHFNPKQVAIAKNGEVIVRSQLEKTRFQEKDEIEIFHAVGGG